MRMLGSVVTFVLLVLSAHWTILMMNPGITDARTSRVTPAQVSPLSNR